MEPPWIAPLLSLPDRLDASLSLVAEFVSAPREDRLAIENGWNYGAKWTYPSPWRLACRNGERGSPEERIVATLVLNGLDTRADGREELLALAVVYNSCALCGLDPNQIFEKVAALLSGRSAQALRDFAARRPKNRSLEAFQLSVVTVDGEPELRASWSKRAPADP